jgi:hypothetical protein
MQVLRSGGCALTKAEALLMLYRACCLYDGACEVTPDWVRIISGGNPEVLEKAVEIAWNDDTYADVVWEDGLP